MDWIEEFCGEPGFAHAREWLPEWFAAWRAKNPAYPEPEWRRWAPERLPEDSPLLAYLAAIADVKVRRVVPQWLPEESPVLAALAGDVDPWVRRVVARRLNG